MTAYLDDPTAGAVYLSRFYGAPPEAREFAVRFHELPETDQTMVVLALAGRVPGACSDAINELPCMAGCGHRRRAVGRRRGSHRHGSRQP